MRAVRDRVDMTDAALGERFDVPGSGARSGYQRLRRFFKGLTPPLDALVEMLERAGFRESATLALWLRSEGPPPAWILNESENAFATEARASPADSLAAAPCAIGRLSCERSRARLLLLGMRRQARGQRSLLSLLRPATVRATMAT
jgi:hypothetical protein